MKNKKIKNLKNRYGTVFIELLLYMAIFLVLVPILLTVSINSIKLEERHSAEKQVSIDSRFLVERIYDIIVDAKRIDVENSVFSDADGKLVLIMQDDTTIIIEANPTNNTIEITEGGQTTELSSSEAVIEHLFFEKIPDALNDPELVLGVNMRLEISAIEEYDPLQNYVVSANLERGDYDDDDCPDFIDHFPKHDQCCRDVDDDGTCDEMDNCVLAYNPFQEDLDEDDIGDACDLSAFEFPSYNCSDDQGLIDLINQVPPLPPGHLKNILMSSNPLSPTVLQALIDKDPAAPDGHIKQIFVANTKLYTDTYTNVMAMDISQGNKNSIEDAQDEATEYAWTEEGVPPTEIEYDITLSGAGEEYGEEQIADNYKIKFDNADEDLGVEETFQQTDIFIITANDGSAEVTVTIQDDDSNTETFILNGIGDSFTTSFGFGATLDDYEGNNYMFKVSNISNDEEMDYVEFNFGIQAEITSPTDSIYTARRYTYYCPGGCEGNCGDSGTGIIIGDVITDQCYKAIGGYPEWCSVWFTFFNNDASAPAYEGGNQEGEEELYWEKTFQTVLSEVQIEHLESITVTGEIAYQSIAQFFCDQFAAECLMNGDLSGAQDVELYDWVSETWEIIGVVGLSNSTSNQQTFSVIYDGSNPQKFIGGEENRQIKARMEFNWNGIPPEGESAPCFMLIDYFTLHLKW